MHRNSKTWIRSAAMLLAAGCLVTLAGCGGGGNKGKVIGKVVAGGQSVTGGELSFSPIAGPSGTEAASSAIATIKPDGTFEAMTDKPGDGAAIGKHRVLFNPPPDEQVEWDGYGVQPPVKVSPFKGLVPKEAEIEVKSGSNDITVELVPMIRRG